MKKKKSWKEGLVFIIIVCIVGGLLIIYPLQKSLAMMRWQEYMKAQGLAKEDVLEREIFKNYKDGGYRMIVKYRGDLNHTYIYDYFLYTHKRNENVKWHQMTCDVIETPSNLPPSESSSSP
ncbi:MAG: DUF3139 domain-containing protein [Tissierellia bacterium]|nr:DUF3139 domain-containing protein [Tissierellia bacterium]